MVEAGRRINWTKVYHGTESCTSVIGRILETRWEKSNGKTALSCCELKVGVHKIHSSA